MEISIIAAMTNDRVIGKGLSIPWRIPEDTKLFMESTKGTVVIMGKNTWLSLSPKSRPLPDRVNIIVSRTLPLQEGAVICATVEEALKLAATYKKKVYCIGGAQLYTQMLPMAKYLQISWVKKQYDGDIIFPKIDLNQWKEIETRDFDQFTYKKYERIDS